MERPSAQAEDSVAYEAETQTPFEEGLDDVCHDARWSRTDQDSGSRDVARHHHHQTIRPLQLAVAAYAAIGLARGLTDELAPVFKVH